MNLKKIAGFSQAKGQHSLPNGVKEMWKRFTKLIGKVMAAYTKMRKITPGGTVAVVSDRLAAAIDAGEWPQNAKEQLQTQDKVLTRFDYNRGPMFYLGQQIVKQMQKAGYPSKIVLCHRTAKKQAELYEKGRSAPGPVVTNAGPYQSPHQYYCAVDICHKHKGWDVPSDYWEALATAVRIVSEKYAVPLSHGHYWRFTDSAHIELSNWKAFRAEVGKNEPSAAQLDALFADQLPQQWRVYTRSRAFEKRLHLS